MPTVRNLKDFIQERLAFAADEIFQIFELSIAKHVEEIDRQRKLLDIISKPRVKLHRIELQQQHVFKEETLWNELQNSSLDQEDNSRGQQPPQIELSVIQVGEQQEMKQETKQETDDCVLFSTCVESHKNNESVESFSDVSQSSAEEQPVVSGFAESPLALAQDGNEGHHHRDSLLDQDSEYLTGVRNVERRREGDRDSGKNSSMLKKSEEASKIEEQFKCNICGKVVKTLYILKAHTKIHTGKRPHKCGVCGRGFLRPRDRQTHMMVHTGEKPHSCDTCGKRFATKWRLAAHQMSHTDEKPFSCHICEKGFQFQWALKAHIRCHTGETPHVCDLCGTKFVCKSKLRQHMLIHTGERPFTCHICGKGFRNLSHLTTHKKTHSGAQPGGIVLHRR